MSWARCHELSLQVEIRSPGELVKAIRVIRGNLDDGTLAQVARAGLGWSMAPFQSVSENGPWEDVLLYEFACRSCAAKFQLSVETYHGRGGYWRPTESAG